MYEVVLGIGIVILLVIVVLIFFISGKAKDEYPVIYKSKKRK